MQRRPTNSSKLHDAHRRVRISLLCRDEAALADGVSDAVREIGTTAVPVGDGRWVVACGCGAAHRLTLMDWAMWRVSDWFYGSFEGAIEAIVEHRRLTCSRRTQ